MYSSSSVSSIPLTTNEYDEWGNPNNKDSYDYMLAYSPYDNVAAVDYPNMLVFYRMGEGHVNGRFRANF